jgi:hypothetical protein
VSPADSRSAGRAGRRRSQSGPRLSVQPTRSDPDRFDARRRAIGASEPARSGRRNGTRTATPERRAWLRSACDRSIRIGTWWSSPRSSRRTEHLGRNSHACLWWGSSSSRPTPRRPPTASPRSPPGRRREAGAGHEDPSWRRLDRSRLDYHINHYTRLGRPRQSPVSTKVRTRPQVDTPVEKTSLARSHLGGILIMAGTRRKIRAIGTIRRSGTAVGADATLGLMGAALLNARAVRAARRLPEEGGNEATTVPPPGGSPHLHCGGVPLWWGVPRRNEGRAFRRSTAGWYSPRITPPRRPR